jgi:Flp pilus assembly pilin Flp
MRQLLKNEKGQGTLEYVIIAAAIIGLAILLIRTVEGPAQTKIAGIGTALQQGANNGTP